MWFDKATLRSTVTSRSYSSTCNWINVNRALCSITPTKETDSDLSRRKLCYKLRKNNDILINTFTLAEVNVSMYNLKIILKNDMSLLPHTTISHVWFLWVIVSFKDPKEAQCEL